MSETRKPPVPTEHDEQVKLFAWIALHLKRHPYLGLAFAVPNGGQRHKAVAVKLRAEGVKRGVPDIWLPVPRGGYHGMVIELKRQKGGRLEPEQRAWLDALYDMGYFTATCAGWEKARDALLAYDELPLTPVEAEAA